MESSQASQYEVTLGEPISLADKDDEDLNDRMLQ